MHVCFLVSFSLLQDKLTCSKSLTLCSREVVLLAISLILDWYPSGLNLIDWISRGIADSPRFWLLLLCHNWFSSSCRLHSASFALYFKRTVPKKVVWGYQPNCLNQTLVKWNVGGRLHIWLYRLFIACLAYISIHWWIYFSCCGTW